MSLTLRVNLLFVSARRRDEEWARRPVAGVSPKRETDLIECIWNVWSWILNTVPVILLCISFWNFLHPKNLQVMLGRDKLQQRAHVSLNFKWTSVTRSLLVNVSKELILPVSWAPNVMMIILVGFFYFVSDQEISIRIALRGALNSNERNYHAFI